MLGGEDWRAQNQCRENNNEVVNSIEAQPRPCKWALVSLEETKAQAQGRESTSGPGEQRPWTAESNAGHILSFPAVLASPLLYSTWWTLCHTWPQPGQPISEVS